MEPSFVPYRPDADGEALVAWLCAEEWPYHLHRRPAPAATRARLDGFDSPRDRSFWIVRAGERVGLLAVHELDDPTPVFDLRLRRAARGQGLGVAALAWLAAWTFTEADKHRIEGHTRADNQPMRRVFAKAGWTQEAHYREAWPDEDGVTWHDAVACALLRREWAAT